MCVYNMLYFCHLDVTRLAGNCWPHTHIHTHIHIYTYTHTHTHTRIHIHTYTHVYTYTAPTTSTRPPTTTPCVPKFEWAHWGPCTPPCSSNAVQIRFKRVTRSCGKNNLVQAQETQPCSVNYTAAGVRTQGTTGMSVDSGDGAWPYLDLFKSVQNGGLLYIATNLWDIMYPKNKKDVGDTEFSR